MQVYSKKNHILKFLILNAVITIGIFSSSIALSEEIKHVAITQIVEHPALDAVNLGIQDELTAQGFIQGTNLKLAFESAQGSTATAAQIAKKFVGDSPDVMVGIATPSAQALAASARGIPIVFAAVTDPVGAKLVKSMQDNSGSSITGVSDLSPIDQHMALIKQVIPEAKRIGVIYNSGEANSASLVDLVAKHAPEQDFSLVKTSVAKTSDVLSAARSLIGKVDAIYIPTDNTVVSAFEAVVKVAQQANIPLFAADTDSVKRGAIAALGFNYYDLGRQTGKIVADILNGKKPSEIPAQGVTETELHVNPAAAKSMGVELPSELVSSAKKVIKAGS